MKRITLIALSILFLGSLAFGETLNLKATWTANTEPDMASYKLYRTDVPRVLVGTIPHPTTVYNFSTSVPDGSEMTLSFILTAVDQAGNESGDSAPGTFPFDHKPPAVPAGGPVISKQP
jgi:hypothetical protein